MPHDIGGYVELKRRFPRQRWSCGEHSYTKWDFKELIDRGAVDILQPDTNRVAGLTEMIKICAMPEAAVLPVVPHATDMHNLQLVFSRAAHLCPLVEYFPLTEPDTGNELFWKAFHGQPLAEDGFLRLGDAPGLGIEVKCRRSRATDARRTDRNDPAIDRALLMLSLPQTARERNGRT